MDMRITCIVAIAGLLASCSDSPPRQPAKPAIGSIVRLDPAFDMLVAKDARIEKVAGDFSFVEGPLWRGDGHL
jgi:gluconolactonase